MKALILIFIFHSLFICAQDNEDINKIISPFIVDNTLYIEGKIDSHIYDFFSYNRKEIQNIKYISLNSFGGSHYWGLEIAQKIQSLEKYTVLKKGNVCASACVYLFGSGKLRMAHKETWFGIHGARLSKGNAFKLINHCYFQNKDGLYEFDLNLEGCEKVHDEIYLISYLATKDAFSLIETSGVSDKLMKDYFNLDIDPNWPYHLNVLKIKDWELSAIDAFSYNLVNILLVE